ncbi:MAG: hypothetical protein PHF09_01540 [Candidatus Nanoarchaeia archaeon]|nr:hypothetical protein [Candidatus Nanoarchaeia archaeon]
MNKKKIERKNKFLILNLIILLLIFVLFLLIFVESVYTDIGSVEYYRLVAGNEYRFSKYSGIGGYAGYTRIVYSSGLDLFLPLKTNAEWSAFYNYKPSTVTITYPTCEMIGTTNWGTSGIYSCSGANQRCYGNVCRTCSGYMYSDGCSGCAGQGGNACWRHVSYSTNTNCNSICSSYGGCISANTNHDTSCTVCKAQVSSSFDCMYTSNNGPPYHSKGTAWTGTVYWCYYRSYGYNMDCGYNKDGPFCVCNY